MNSTFSGSVRGSRQVGGLAGWAWDSNFENVKVSSTSLVQADTDVGGIAGNSNFFNRLFDVQVDGSLYSAGIIHPIAPPYTQGGFTFRPADIYSNVKFKGSAIVANPPLVPQLRGPDVSLMTMPTAQVPGLKTPAQLGLSFTVPGATLTSGVYVINAANAVQGSTAVHRNVQISGTSPFYIGGVNNTASMSFTDSVTIGVSGPGYTNWGFGIGLPTNTVGTIDRTSSLVIVTDAGQTELKIQVKGTVTAP